MSDSDGSLESNLGVQSVNSDYHTEQVKVTQPAFSVSSSHHLNAMTPSDVLARFWESHPPFDMTTQPSPIPSDPIDDLQVPKLDSNENSEKNRFRLHPWTLTFVSVLILGFAFTSHYWIQWPWQNVTMKQPVTQTKMHVVTVTRTILIEKTVPPDSFTEQRQIWQNQAEKMWQWMQEQHQQLRLEKWFKLLESNWKGWLDWLNEENWKYFHKSNWQYGQYGQMSYLTDCWNQYKNSITNHYNEWMQPMNTHLTDLWHTSPADAFEAMKRYLFRT